MNKNTKIGFIMGVGLTVLFTIGINLLPISYVSKYKAAIGQCEAELPRNQHCKITAIPEDNQ